VVGSNEVRVEAIARWLSKRKGELVRLHDAFGRWLHVPEMRSSW
jgi:hypothetical protein